jgi:sugar (pentulose or hexulose) kinase
MQTEDASAVGAAYLAMEIFGYKYTIIDVTMTIEPEDDKYTIYQKSFSIYKSLYPSLKEVMHQFYQLNH